MSDPLRHVRQILVGTTITSVEEASDGNLALTVVEPNGSTHKLTVTVSDLHWRGIGQPPPRLEKVGDHDVQT